MYFSFFNFKDLDSEVRLGDINYSWLMKMLVEDFSLQKALRTETFAGVGIKENRSKSKYFN